jgi:hypothetical protein
MDGSALPLIHGMAFWSAAVATVAWVLVQRSGRTPATEPAR